MNVGQKKGLFAILSLLLGATAVGLSMENAEHTQPWGEGLEIPIILCWILFLVCVYMIFASKEKK